MRALLRLVLAVLVLAALPGCEAAFNTAYGSGSVRPPTLIKKTSTTTRTEATPTAPAAESHRCEGGVCTVEGR